MSETTLPHGTNPPAGSTRAARRDENCACNDSSSFDLDRGEYGMIVSNSFPAPYSPR